MPPWRPGDFEDKVYVPKVINELPLASYFYGCSAIESVPLPCQVVKVLYSPDNVVYFMQTRESKFHHEFWTALGKESRSIADFNKQVYTGEKRDLICASLVAYTDAAKQPVYAFEMVPTDPLLVENSQRVREAFDAFQKACPFATLHFRPTSQAQIENVANPNHPLHNIPQVDTWQLWKMTPYVPIVNGSTNGILRWLPDAAPERLENLTINDIVVFNSGIPNEIPPVAAVIVTEPLPPLCHVSLLCKNRGTPMAYVEMSPGLKENSKQNGKATFISLTSNQWVLMPSQVNTTHWRSPLPDSVAVTPPHADPVDPVAFTEMSTKASWTNSGVMGAKAYQCFLLDGVAEQLDFHKKSFIIPMGSYLKHINSDPKLAQAIKTFLQTSSRTPAAKTTPKSVKQPLADIQAMIKAHPVDKALLNKTIELIKASGCERVILRSSTNAEDIQRFNAAGLYDSVVVNANPIDPAQVASAIQAVWSSVWNVRAYLERRLFGIPSSKVAMSILVQPHISNDSILANGVALTSNPFDHAKYGVYVTALPGGEHRATDAVSSNVLVPEQTVIHMSRVPGLFEPELIAPARGASINSFKPVLTSEMALQLGQKCAKIHSAILKEDIATTAKATYTTTCLDIEWLVLKPTLANPHPELIIVQARPSQIQYY